VWHARRFDAVGSARHGWLYDARLSCALGATFSNVQVWGEGNLAYGTSSYTLTLQGAPPDNGKQLAVFRRGANGEWQVVAVSFNSDLPLPGQANTTTTSLQ
jgi:hypothetical protein